MQWGNTGRTGQSFVADRASHVRRVPRAVAGTTLWVTGFLLLGSCRLAVAGGQVVTSANTPPSGGTPATIGGSRGGAGGGFSATGALLGEAFPGRAKAKAASFSDVVAKTEKTESGFLRPLGSVYRQQLVRKLETLVGIPYLSGGRTPGAGLDTVGLIYHLYKSINIEVPDCVEGLTTVGTRVSRDELVERGRLRESARLYPGDILLIQTVNQSGESSGVRPLLYVGGNTVALSSRSSGQVVLADMGIFASGIAHAQRVIPADGRLVRQTEEFKSKPFVARATNWNIGTSRASSWMDQGSSRSWGTGTRSWEPATTGGEVLTVDATNPLGDAQGQLQAAYYRALRAAGNSWARTGGSPLASRAKEYSDGSSELLYYSSLEKLDAARRLPPAEQAKAAQNILREYKPSLDVIRENANR